MPSPVNPPINRDEIRCRFKGGVLEIPVHYMRGGTSTGVVIWEPLVPSDDRLRAELLQRLMGVPLAGSRPGNKQVAGLGRGTATSNKVFLAKIEDTPAGSRLVSTLAQLASTHGDIDWSVNCGNMSSALPLWALDTNLIQSGPPGPQDIEIKNTNTGVVTISRMFRNNDGDFALAEIPGVLGTFPQVDLFLQAPVGNKTGALLPTGNVTDVVEGHEVSCVDVAVPMVIATASSFGKTGHESITDLENDADFMWQLRKVWVAAGLKMGLRRRDGGLMTKEEIERSETIPKVCIVGESVNGGSISVRYFTPQFAHASMAVSGGCCLAAACLIPGSTANRVAVGLDALSDSFRDIEVSIENPAGKLDATVTARMMGQGIEITAAAYRRTAQILMRGHVPLYGASLDLVRALTESCPVA